MMRRPSLAIDASRAATRTMTGTEWYATEIIRAIIAQSDRPKLTLYHRAPPPSALDGARVSHRRIKAPRLWTHIGLSSAMLRDRPDALFVPAHVIPITHPRASVVTIHDLGYLVEPEAHPASTRRMLDITTRWNARVARKIVAVSSQTRDDLIRHYRVPDSRIEVVLSGLDHDRFRVIDPDAARATVARLGVRQPFVLFVGTVQPRKNLERLVEAFEMIADERLQLVVAGKSGWLSAPIEKRLTAGRAASRVVRLGYVPDDALPALYNAAEVFVFPSLYEGFGMPIVEAMACGCPVVTSDRSSPPEIAGGAALLVDPLDAAAIRDGISRARNPHVRQSLRREGLERARDFSWQRAARLTLAVIEDAMRGR